MIEERMADQEDRLTRSFRLRGPARKPRSERIAPTPQTPTADPDIPSTVSRVNALLNGNGNGSHGSVGSITTAAVAQPKASFVDRVKQARQKGYEGDPCSDCGQLTLVRSGTCLKCDTCGTSSGCA